MTVEETTGECVPGPGVGAGVTEQEQALGLVEDQVQGARWRPKDTLSRESDVSLRDGQVPREMDQGTRSGHGQKCVTPTDVGKHRGDLRGQNYSCPGG